MLAFLGLVSISGLQMYNSSINNTDAKRNWVSNRGSFGIEFQVDEERGIPFMPRGNSGPNDEPDNDNDDENGRGFNNPNISVSVKFKNKIRNNNYEFIVTIEPERI